MYQRRLLASVSAAHLASAATGMAVAMRRGHSVDVPFMRGHPDNIAHESILQGTALSAPVTMLAAQAMATAVLARRPSAGAARAIGMLGALNVAGYLSERLVRRRLTSTGWDPIESPLIVAGISLAAVLPLIARAIAARPPRDSEATRTAELPTPGDR